MPTAILRSPLCLPSVSALDAVWRASELGVGRAGSTSGTVPSGHAGLDAELPGAGWPRGNLSELLQAQAGVHEWRLLLPALRACLAAAGKQTLVLIGSPQQLNLWALACHGIPSHAVLLVEAEQPAQRLWAAEQALRCRDLAALLLWAPQARPEQLRRLQVAAQAVKHGSAQGGLCPPPPLVFVCRPWLAQLEPSPAPLRVGVKLASQGQLAVHVLKRRGPVHAAPLLLAAALSPVMPPALQSSMAERGRPAHPLPSHEAFFDCVPAYALDRLVSLAPHLDQPLAA